jgi:hypothetical protein
MMENAGKASITFSEQEPYWWRRLRSQTHMNRLVMILCLELGPDLKLVEGLTGSINE